MKTPWNKYDPSDISTHPLEQRKYIVVTVDGDIHKQMFWLGYPWYKDIAYWAEPKDLIGSLMPGEFK